MDTYQVLTEAIRGKLRVAARYGGEERIFSPHALGRKAGAYRVLVYQFAGGSRSGLPPGGEWRCLDLARLRDVRLEEGPWRTATNVFSPQTCLDEVELVADLLPPRERPSERGPA